MQMLKTTKEFDFVYKNSYKFRSESLDICVLRANMAGQFYEKFKRLPCNLIGFSVSKKVGNAVERNLIKRRLRAICREFFGLGNSSLTQSSREFEKSAFNRQQVLFQADFSAQPTNLAQDTRIANDKNIIKSNAQKDNAQNLICIFIAKSQILQTPFATLKSTIFATLKRQLNFKKNSHTSPRNFSANRPQTKAKQNENR